MNERQRRHLSALVDGEVDPALAHPFLSALESNEHLVATWEGYHLIGAAMRSEEVRPEYRLISARVSERIATEPAPAHKPAARRGWTLRRGPFVGAALAAFAALVAMVVAPQLFKLRPEVEPPPGLHIASSTSQEGFQTTDSPKRWHVDEPAMEDKLDRLLVNHQERSPVSRMQGFLPYATLVGYETRR